MKVVRTPNNPGMESFNPEKSSNNPCCFYSIVHPPPPQFPPCEWIMLLWEWLKRSLQFPLHKLDLQVIYNWKTDDITSGTREVDLHGWLWAVQGWTGNNNNLIISKLDRCKYLSKIFIQMHHREKNTIILIIVITIIIMNNYDHKNFKIRW